VELLRIQLQKEKDGVKKHKQMTKETIQKKIEVNKINQWVKDKLVRNPKTIVKNYNGLISLENGTSL
jgi:hypothetical protein